MKDTMAVFALVVLLFSAACGGNKIDSKIAEMGAKTATTVEEAKVLRDEAVKFVRWIEAKESPSPEQLARAKALVAKRTDELVALGGDKILSGVTEALKSIGIDVGSINPGAAKDWFLGVNDPRLEKFGCKPPRDATDPRGFKDCP